MVQLSLWGLLSQEGEASLRQPLLRELLRLPALPRLLELPLSLLLVIRRHGSRQQGLRSRSLPRLAQNEERKCTGREARSRRRLGQMSRRKSEITGHMNERDFPHLVELELPSGGFRNKSLEFDSFHRERGLVIRLREFVAKASRTSTLDLPTRSWAAANPPRSG